MRDEFLTDHAWRETDPDSSSYRAKIGEHPMPMQVRYDRVDGEICQTLAIARDAVQMQVSLTHMSLGRWVRLFGHWPRWYRALRIPYDLAPSDHFRMIARCGAKGRTEYVLEINEEPLAVGTAPLGRDWLLWLHTWPAYRQLRDMLS